MPPPLVCSSIGHKVKRKINGSRSIKIILDAIPCQRANSLTRSFLNTRKGKGEKKCQLIFYANKAELERTATDADKIWFIQ